MSVADGGGGAFDEVMLLMSDISGGARKGPLGQKEGGLSRPPRVARLVVPASSSLGVSVSSSSSSASTTPMSDNANAPVATQVIPLVQSTGDTEITNSVDDDTRETKILRQELRGGGDDDTAEGRQMSVLSTRPQWGWLVVVIIFFLIVAVIVFILTSKRTPEKHTTPQAEIRQLEPEPEPQHTPVIATIVESKTEDVQPVLPQPVTVPHMTLGQAQERLIRQAAALSIEDAYALLEKRRKLRTAASAKAKAKAAKGRIDTTEERNDEDEDVDDEEMTRE